MKYIIQQRIKSKVPKTLTNLLRVSICTIFECTIFEFSRISIDRIYNAIHCIAAGLLFD